MLHLAPSSFPGRNGGAPRTFFIFAGLCAIVTLGVVLRIISLTGQNFWYDETYSFDISRLPFEKIVESAQGDMHPPLFYMILKGWESLFGTSDVALRSLSVFSSVVSLILTFHIGRRMGTSVALSATLLMSLCAHQVYYAQETRMYALITALTLAAALCYRRWLESNFKRRTALAAYILLSAAGMYTHYFVMLIVAAINVHWALHTIHTWRDGALHFRRMVVAWTLAQTIIGVLYLPWIGVFLTQAKRGQPWRSPTPIIQAIKNGVGFIEIAALGYGTNLDVAGVPVEDSQSSRQTASFQIRFVARWVIFLLLGVGLGWGVVGWRRGVEREYFSAIVFVVPLIIAIGVSLRQSIDLSRYLLIITPHFFCLITLGFARILRSQSQFLEARRASYADLRRFFHGSALGIFAQTLLAGVCLLGIFFGLLDYYATPSRDSDVRPVLTDIQTRIQPGDRIIIDPDYNDSSLLFYARRYGLENALVPAEHRPPSGQGQIFYVAVHPEIVRLWVILDYRSEFFNQPTIDPNALVKSVRTYPAHHPRLRLLEIERVPYVQ